MRIMISKYNYIDQTWTIKLSLIQVHVCAELNSFYFCEIVGMQYLPYIKRLLRGEPSILEYDSDDVQDFIHERGNESIVFHSMNPPE